VSLTKPGAEDNLDVLAQRLGNQISARVTIIARDGTVLAIQRKTKAMENHASRPEVVDALSSGVGESIRYSIAIGQRMMYVAIPIVTKVKLLGGTGALPLAKVDSSVSRLALPSSWR